MKRVEKCILEDCIPTPSSCVIWNGGDIPFLGVCDGDCLNYLMTQLLKELQRIAGKDLSTFDITSLLAICKKTAPEEITITSILTLLRDNQLCLKLYIDELDFQLQKLLNSESITIDIKCYTGFDDLGLSITRDQLDQLVINILCSHQLSMDSADSSITRIQENINEAERNKSVEEVQVATCVNEMSLSLSYQVQNTSKELCDFISAMGTSVDIALALSKTPTDLNGEFGGITGWNPSPVLWSEYYSNTLLEVQNLRERVATIENTCCAVTCDDITVGFTSTLSSDGTSIIITFSKGAGMILPTGFEDCGSTGTVTDSKGNIQHFDIAIISSGSVEIPLDGISAGDLSINISSRICNIKKNLVCEKCIDGTVSGTACPPSPVCKVCVTSDSVNTGAYIELTYLYSSAYTTIRIPQGQCNYVPTDAVVVSIDRVLGATEDSDCLDLSNVEQKTCYQIEWASNEDTTPSDVLEHQDSNIDYIEVGGIQYSINQQPNLENDTDGALEAIIRGIVPQYLMTLDRIDTNTTGNRFEDTLFFKAVPSIANSIVMKITGPGYGIGLYIKPLQCDDCCSTDNGFVATTTSTTTTTTLP